MKIRTMSLIALTTVGAATAYAGTGLAKGPNPAPNAEKVGGNKAEKKANLNDAQILGVADVANTGEVDQGILAESKAVAAPVRSFAQTMVAEHQDSKQKTDDLAKKLGVSPSSSSLSEDLKKEADAMMVQLNKANRPTFDRTYVQAQIKMHERVLKTIDSKLKPEASSPEVKSLLSDMRDHVLRHLSVAQSTLKQLNK